MADIPQNPTHVHPTAPPYLTRQVLWANRTVIAASSAAVVGVLAGYPFDSIKTRMQTQPYTSIMACIRHTYHEEGARGFFRGILPPLITVSIIKSISFTVYEQTKAYCRQILWLDQKTLASTMALSTTGGTVAGAFIATLSCPFELVKIQKQLEFLLQASSISTGATVMRPMAETETDIGTGTGTKRQTVTRTVGAGLPVSCTAQPPIPIHTSPAIEKMPSTAKKRVSTSSWYSAKEIIRKKGVAGLWSGFGLHFVRDALGTGVYFGGYETTKYLLQGSDHPAGPLTQFFAGGVCGILCWLVVFPIDLVKSLMQKDIMALQPTYAHTTQCIREIYATRGALGFYRGITVTLVRAFPIHSLNFLVVDDLLFYDLEMTASPLPEELSECIYHPTVVTIHKSLTYPPITFTTPSYTFCCMDASMDSLLSPTTTQFERQQPMLAWCQSQLRNYIELSLLHPITDLCESWQDGQVLLCFAHRFFPESIPDLITKLQSNRPNENTRLAYSLFADKLQIQPPPFLNEEGVMDYLKRLRHALDRTDVMQPHGDWRTEFEHKAALVLTTATDPFSQLHAHLAILESKDLPEFRSTVRHLPLDANHPRVEAVEAAYSALQLQLKRGTTDLDHIITPIRNELDFIQAKMLKTTTTDTGIQDLENRVVRAGELIRNVEEQYGHLLPSNQDYQLLLNDIVHQHTIVCRWVEEVRVWYVEADRIRNYLQTHINALENTAIADGLEEIEIEYTSDQLHQLNDEHQILQAQIEEFNHTDMTRLRDHVKALTGTERAEELSPADTTTIEITFTTLTTLDRLMHLLLQRTHDVRLLTLRVAWEQHYETAIEWVRETAQEMTVFVAKARWQMDTATGECVQSLVDLEQRIKAFDEKEFSTTVNVYQELDDSSHIELPSHLESRQVALEEAFEQMTVRIAFARQVVEQRLMVNEFMTRADTLKTDGDALRLALLEAEKQAKMGDTDKQFRERVQLFQEGALQLVTGVATRIIYPEATQPCDQQDTYDANDGLQSMISTKKSALILFGESLEHKLTSYRRVLQLLQQMNTLQEESTRLEAWVDERSRKISKARVDVFVAKCALDTTDLGRLQRERDGQRAKIKAFWENDLGKVNKSIQTLEQAASKHTMTLPTQRVRDRMEKVIVQLKSLEERVDQHSNELQVLASRIEWENGVQKTTQWIANTTLKVWGFVSQQAQWRPCDAAVHSGDMSPSSMSKQWTDVLSEFDSLEYKRSEFVQHSLASLDSAFEALRNGFILCASYGKPFTPDLVQQRQERVHENAVYLAETMAYARDVLDQHVALDQYVGTAHSAQSEGLQLLHDVEAALESLQVSPDCFGDRLKRFDQDVFRLWKQQGSVLPYPVCPEEARATRPSTQDDDIGSEILSMALKVYDDLLQLGKRIRDLLEMYGQQVQWKKEVEDCFSGGQQVMATIIAVHATIKTASLDPSVMETMGTAARATLVQVAAHGQEESIRLLKHLTAFEDHLGEVVTLIGEMASIDPVPATRVLAEARTHAEQLKELTQSHALQVRAYIARMEWEDSWREVYSQTRKLHTTARSLESDISTVLAKDAKTTYLEIVQLQTTAHQATDTLKRMKEALPETLKAFDTTQAAFASASLTTPMECMDRHQELQTSMTCLDEQLEQRQNTLDFLVARAEWEQQVELQQQQWDTHCAQVEVYLSQRARWTPAAYTDCDLESKKKQYIEAYHHHQQTTETLLKTLDTLQSTQPTSDMDLASPSVDASVAAIYHTHSTAQQQLELMEAVLSQRTAIQECIREADTIETLADTIKATFLAADGKTEAQEDALRDYSGQLAVFSDHIKTRIHWPERPNYAIDAKANEVARDYMKTRQMRLEDLSHSLLAILKSKERLSRRNAAVEAYLAEAKVVEGWMKAHALAREVPGELMALREAVATTHSLQLATHHYTHVYHSLKESAAHHVTTIQQELDVCIETEEGREAAESVEKIRGVQHAINNSWNALVEETDVMHTTLLTKLRLAEFNALVQATETHMKKESELIHSATIETLDEDDMTKWNQSIHTTIYQQVERIATLSSEEEKENIHTEEMQTSLYRVKTQYDTLVSDLQLLTKQVTSYHLHQNYASSADRLEAFIEKTRTTLQNARTLTKDQTREEDPSLLLAAYTSVKEAVEDHTDCLDKTRSLYHFIEFQKMETPQVQTRQQQLESNWKTLQYEVKLTKTAADDVSHAHDLHTMLHQVNTSLDLLEPTLATKEWTASELANTILQTQKIWATLEAVQSMAATKPLGTHQSMFESHYTTTKARLEAVDVQLANHKADLQKQAAYEACVSLARTLQTEASQESAAIRKRVEEATTTDIFEKATVLEQYHRASLSHLSASETVYKRLTGHLMVHLQEKTAALPIESDKREELLAVAQTAFKELSQCIQQEKQLTDKVRRILGHAKSAESIVSWIHNCENAIQVMMTDAMTMDEQEASMETQDIGHKMEQFYKIVSSFEEMTVALTQEHLGNEAGSNAVESERVNTTEENIETELSVKEAVPSHTHTYKDITSPMDENSNNIKCKEDVEKENLQALELVSLKNSVISRAENVKEQWYHLNELLDELKASIVTSSQGLAVARKVKTIMMLLGEVREHLATMQVSEETDTTTDDDSVSEKSTLSLSSMLREQEVIAIQEDMDLLETEARQQLEQETEALDKLIEKYNKDTFVQQRHEIDASVQSIMEAMSTKRQEINKARSISSYLSATDDVEVILSALEDAVDKAAPYKATMIGSSFSRADLQAKLIELDARYKYYESKATQGLDTARQCESPLHPPLQTHLKELNTRWHIVSELVKSRKDELVKTMEGAVDQEHRQVRNRKSSLPTRKAASLRERDIGSLRVVSSASASANTSLAFSRLSPSLSTRSGNPRHQTSRLLNLGHPNQPSKSTNSMKVPAIRVTRTPPNAYVADPDNDLDIEIGRIVNETPYRVKVKMVPGEVGRYWFGDVNAKMAYCRVLKSKMVMVRVGGGWTELSQFLRDHALLEGEFIPKSRTEEEVEQKTLPCIQEGFIETHRAKSPSGRPLPRSRATSSPTPPPNPSRSNSAQIGYVDGDKYIAVDRHGNQLEVRMTRAMNKAPSMSERPTRRRVPRKRDV
ncbi:hypothetical protein BDF14DRAFT_1743342 [Spinellus fusiger]|nr:hypothetical protein BDF14DRAFT_1743342 [Spinellus fusiger]